MRESERAEACCGRRCVVSVASAPTPARIRELRGHAPADHRPPGPDGRLPGSEATPRTAAPIAIARRADLRLASAAMGCRATKRRDAVGLPGQRSPVREPTSGSPVLSGRRQGIRPTRGRDERGTGHRHTGAHRSITSEGAPGWVAHRSPAWRALPVPEHIPDEAQNPKSTSVKYQRLEVSHSTIRAANRVPPKVGSAQPGNRRSLRTSSFTARKP